MGILWRSDSGTWSCRRWPLLPESHRETKTERNNNRRGDLTFLMKMSFGPSENSLRTERLVLSGLPVLKITQQNGQTQYKLARGISIQSIPADQRASLMI